MNMAMIDGKAVAQSLSTRIATEVERLHAEHNLIPGLAVVLVGEDQASQIYVRNKGIQTRKAGMASFEHKLPASTPQADIIALVERLNADPRVHGILVQLPLPAHVNAPDVINAIAPGKDVDGFHISNAGLLSTGQLGIVPCTPLGCLILLRRQLGSLKGLNAVVIGRSNIVGKPMAQLLLGEDCTVTIAHRWTRDLPSICRDADILVAAVGQPGLIKKDWVKPGATIIDVGINRIERDGKFWLVGDVDPEVASMTGAMTPVPGGVGPMTIACLLANTLTACRRLHHLPEPEQFLA